MLFSFVFVLNEKSSFRDLVSQFEASRMARHLRSPGPDNPCLPSCSVNIFSGFRDFVSVVLAILQVSAQSRISARLSVDRWPEGRSTGRSTDRLWGSQPKPNRECVF